MAATMPDILKTTRLYTIGEVARFSRLSTSTVRRWLYGSDDDSPVLDYGAEREQYAVSFIQLIEIVVASRFRQRQVPLERVRMAHAFATKQLGIDYPFASKKLATQGGRILREYHEEVPGAPLVELNEGQQATLPPLVSAEFQAMNFAPDLYAARWYPFGKNSPIVIDPEINSGAPTIKDRRLTVQAVYKRRKAGLSIARISEDTDLPQEEVDRILLFAEQVRMAA